MQISYDEFLLDRGSCVINLIRTNCGIIRDEKRRNISHRRTFLNRARFSLANVNGSLFFSLFFRILS